MSPQGRPKGESVDALALADETMRGAGFARPRITVCALDPHAGENGLFGSEEIDLIAPVVAKAAARGERVSSTRIVKFAFGDTVATPSRSRNSDLRDSVA